ncbi:hypothetical protein BaRGS_00015440 [Batillaria attramentaria]|uniref:Uncharacterized protein n=1 Tax=Batillaria attramentaria TaxID=370345 RepID=A0ABD0L2H5_9CAEN
MLRLTEKKAGYCLHKIVTWALTWLSSFSGSRLGTLQMAPTENHEQEPGSLTSSEKAEDLHYWILREKDFNQESEAAQPITARC